jgi:hypothetical protein
MTEDHFPLILGLVEWVNKKNRLYRMHGERPASPAGLGGCD